MPTKPTKPRKKRPADKHCGPKTVRNWQDSYDGLIALTAAVPIFTDAEREEIGVHVASSALDMLCPSIRDPDGWLALLSQHLEDLPDAPAGIMRTIALRITEAIAEARMSPPYPVRTIVMPAPMPQ
jgi:hypothetical protein